MTAAEYLQRAENLLQQADREHDNGFVQEEQNLILRALVATTAAIAVELGVPPVTPAPGGDGSD